MSRRIITESIFEGTVFRDSRTGLLMLETIDDFLNPKCYAISSSSSSIDLAALTGQRVKLDASLCPNWWILDLPWRQTKITVHKVLEALIK